MWVQEALFAFPEVCSPKVRALVFIHSTGLHDERAQNVSLIHGKKNEVRGWELREKLCTEAS